MSVFSITNSTLSYHFGWLVFYTYSTAHLSMFLVFILLKTPSLHHGGAGGNFCACLSLLSLFALPSNYLGSLENKEQTSRKFTTRSFSITLLRKRTFFLYNQDIIIQFIFKCPHLSQRHLSEKLFPSPLIQDSTMDHVSLIPYTLV